jgi:hypothetical protein
MSEYQPPPPFSPKPDYKSMDIEQIKKHAMRYGLSTTQSKGRLIKILDEIYNVTHQYETDTDYEFDSNDMNLPKDYSDKKDLSHTPPTPAIIPDKKKAKKRQAIHQMSSSDEIEEYTPPPAKKPTLLTTTADNENGDQSDEDDADHEGRFLELTVHDLSLSTTSSSSLSIISTSPTRLPNDDHPSKYCLASGTARPGVYLLRIRKCRRPQTCVFQRKNKPLPAWVVCSEQFKAPRKAYRDGKRKFFDSFSEFWIDPV